MTHDPSFERLLTDTLGDPITDRLPDRVLEQVFASTRGSRPLPRWLALLKEPPMRLSHRLAVGSPTARLAVIVAATALLAVALAGAAIAGASPAPSPTSGLVTEPVEPGVERIIDDGAGHDLDERHPMYRYDMDTVFVTPDGTVWVQSSYHETDNDANPPGGLTWAVGRPGATQDSSQQFCFRGAPDNASPLGVSCFDLSSGTVTRYLESTRITAVSGAPDGTFWAVGDDGLENGGLYHITPR